MTASKVYAALALAAYAAMACLAISRWNYRGADMRRAVALDAEHLAVMPGDGHA